MPGDEAHLASVAADATAPRRGEALSAMYRLPGLADATVAVVAERVRDADPAVRAAALAVIGRQRLASAEGAVRASLASDVGAVRLAAHRALKAIGAAWQEAARAALDDPDPKLVTYALGELVSAKAIEVERILPLLGSADAEIARAALVALRSSTAPSAALLLLARARTSNDHDTFHALLAQVRAGVVTSAQEEEALGLVLAQLAAETTSFGRFLTALGAFVPRNPRALSALVEATRHPDGFARFEAAHVLGEVLSPPTPTTPANDALAAREARAAIEALEALRGDATMPRAPSRSTAWSVGENATRALAKIRARRGE